MDIRVLRYFLAVCREGTMSRAAEMLHVAQPTLSRQIAELETELGCRLLERHSRGVKPTERGLYLQRRAGEIVALADQTRADFLHDDSIVEGDIAIAAGETHGMQVIAQAIASFRAQYPQVRFHIHSADAADVTWRLENGLADFGILLGYPDVDRYDHFRLAPTDAWGLYLRADDPLCRKQTIGPDDLVGLPLITSEQANATGIMASWLGSAAGKVNVVATYNLVRSAVSLLRAGVGDLLSLEKLIPAGPGTGLEFRLLYPPAVSPIDFCWKRGATLTHAARLFCKHVRMSTAQGANTPVPAAG